MADTRATPDGFAGFSPRRPIGINGSINPLSRTKLAGSTRDIKHGTVLIAGALGTVDRAAVTGTNEVQTLTPTTVTAGYTIVTSAITGNSNQTSTHLFTGSFNIYYNYTAAQAQAAAEAILGVGNVSVTGGPLTSAALLFEFKGELEATNVAALTRSDTNLTGTTAFTTSTAGVIGVMTTASVFGFSMSNDVSLISGFGRWFGGAPLNLDGPFASSTKPILIHPDSPGEVYQGSLWPTEKVTAALVDVACSIGYRPSRGEFCVRSGDNSVPNIRITGFPPEELNKIGGLVDFVVVDGRSDFH